MVPSGSGLLNQYQGFLQSDEEYSDDQYDQMIDWFHSVQDNDWSDKNDLCNR